MIDINDAHDEIKRRETSKVHAMFIMSIIADQSTDDDVTVTIDLAEPGQPMTEIVKCEIKF